MYLPENACCSNQFREWDTHRFVDIRQVHFKGTGRCFRNLTPINFNGPEAAPIIFQYGVQGIRHMRDYGLRSVKQCKSKGNSSEFCKAIR